jgi:hypothetical protein
MTNVRRKVNGKTLIVLLSLTLVVALLAGTGPAYAQETQLVPPPPSVREKSNIIDPGDAGGA